MNDNIKSINTPESGMTEDQRRTLHNFGQAMGQVAQAAEPGNQHQRLFGPTDDYAPPVSFEEAAAREDKLRAVKALLGDVGMPEEAQHKRLDAIRGGGAVVPDNPPGTKPKNAQHLFNVLLPLAVHRATPSQLCALNAKMGNVSYRFEIDGEGGGVWSVDFSQGAVIRDETVPPTIKQTADVTFKLTNGDFVAVLHDPGIAMPLFMQGHIRISGDPMLAMKLQTLIEFFRS